MDFSNLENFADLLELSFSPIVLISGVGLLLLSMVNRFMQTTNRTRQLIQSVEEQHEEERRDTIKQVKILYRRTNILKWAITLVLGSILSTSLLILVISIMSFGQINIQWIGLTFYYITLGLLVGSVVLFLVDLTMATNALRVEASKYLDIS